MAAPYTLPQRSVGLGQNRFDCSVIAALAGWLALPVVGPRRDKISTFSGTVTSARRNQTNPTNTKLYDLGNCIPIYSI